MRICHITSARIPPEEGIGYYVYNLSKKLIDREHEVTIITRGSIRKEMGFVDGITVIKVPFIPLYPFHVNIHGFFVNKLFKSIEKEFDVVHIHTPLSPILKTSLPIVSTIHGSMIGNIRHLDVTDLMSFGVKVLTRLVSYSLVSKLIENSKVVTTVSNSVAYQLKKYYGLDNVILVGNGVDEKIFTPAKEKSNEKCILYVGRLSYGKGLLDLLECAKRICQNHNIKFVLVGKGVLEGKLKKKIRNGDLQDKILIRGHVKYKEIIQIYRNATIFVLPSYYEGLPTALLEAMSCGLPVVATAVSGCVDVVKHEFNGILVQPKSPKKMSEAISILLEDEDLRKKLGRNARMTIEEKYAWNSIVDRIERCYKLVT